MANNVYMNSEALDLINFKLEDKTKKLDDLYKELNNKLSILDGNSIVWKGKAQEAFYEHYTGVSSHFPDIIDQLNSYVLFLAETIENYEKRDQAMDKDIDDNKNNLDVNE